jgi:hypothetical protein
VGELQVWLGKVCGWAGLMELTCDRPCKMISPHFEKFAGATQGVEFIKVDVDEAPVSRSTGNLVLFFRLTDSVEPILGNLGVCRYPGYAHFHRLPQGPIRQDRYRCQTR